MKPETIRCVSYNIQYGLGKDGRYDIARIIDEIGDADIIGLQEVERFWDRSGNVDQLEVIAAAFPDHDMVYGANLDLHKTLQGASGKPVRRRRQFGNMVLSRFAILSSRNVPLPKRAMIHQHSVRKGLLEAVIDAPFGPFRFYCTHLDHLGPATQAPQIARVLDVIETAPHEGGAWGGTHPVPESGWLEGTAPPMPLAAVLVGDLNLTHADPGYAAFLGELTREHGRLTHPLGLQDAWVVAGNPEETGNSRAGRRIDHCLVSADMADRLTGIEIDQSCQGSDHWPLRFEFRAC